MGAFNWLLSGLWRPRRSIEPFVGETLPTQTSTAASARHDQQMQQISDVAKRLDKATAELEQAQTGLTTMRKDIHDGV